MGHELLSCLWCEKHYRDARKQLLCRLLRTFSRTLCRETVVYHSAFTILCYSMGTEQKENKLAIIVLPTILAFRNFVGLLSPSKTHSRDYYLLPDCINKSMFPRRIQNMVFRNRLQCHKQRLIIHG